MKRRISGYLAVGAALAALFAAGVAFGQANNSNTFQTTGNQTVGGVVQMCLISTANGIQAAPCTATPGTNQAGYPPSATPITASATGTTAATTATLAAAAGKVTYLCGFSIRANATAAATGNATVTGTVTGTLNFTQWTAPLASGLGITEPPIGASCIPGSGTNQAIAVVSAAPGSGGTVSVSAWGFQF